MLLQSDKRIIHHSSHVASCSPFHPGISTQGTVTRETPWKETMSGKTSGKENDLP